MEKTTRNSIDHKATVTLHHSYILTKVNFTFSPNHLFMCTKSNNPFIFSASDIIQLMMMNLFWGKGIAQMMQYSLFNLLNFLFFFIASSVLIPIDPEPYTFKSNQIKKLRVERNGKSKWWRKSTFSSTKLKFDFGRVRKIQTNDKKFIESLRVFPKFIRWD